MTSARHVVVCVKWTPAQPNAVPSPSGTTSVDERFTGISLADQAALELALRTGEVTGADVVVITAGPPAADKILREALACGAARALRVDMSSEATSGQAAGAVAHVIASLPDVGLIWCGDYSSDRGSGSFPAFLAACLGLEQSLGLIRVDFPSTGAFPLEVIRRLDGGRRERSIIRANAVLSVEGSLARLRRASLSSSLSAQARPVDVVDTLVDVNSNSESAVLRPYRPRARSMPAPEGATPLDRIRSVTETSSPKGSSDPIVLEPRQAAEVILQRLQEWGYTS